MPWTAAYTTPASGTDAWHALRHRAAGGSFSMAARRRLREDGAGKPRRLPLPRLVAGRPFSRKAGALPPGFVPNVDGARGI